MALRIAVPYSSATRTSEDALIASLRISIAGAGRMSQAIQSLIGAADDLSLAAIWIRQPDNADVANAVTDLDAVLDAGDVLIDFTLPAATRQLIAAAKAHGKPLVCGVSGLEADQLVLLQDAATVIPVVYDRNMSRGIAVLKRLLTNATTALGPDFGVSIHETHHVHKLDAPSGTALKLGEAVAAARGQDFDAVASLRDPDTDSRTDAIKFFSERRGEVPGDHEVVFASPTETLRLSHSVTTRDVFAAGALTAARWAVTQPAGLYSMQDVLDPGNNC